MVTINKNMNHDCKQLLASFFKQFPNLQLQSEANLIMESLQDFNAPMPGKSGGWAGGIVYASANQCRQACGIPNLLNKECEEFFSVSMGTIYKRAAVIKRLLAL